MWPTEIANRESRNAIGLMSGSSCDGVDAALVRLAGTGPTLTAELLCFETFPYPCDFRRRLLASEKDAREVCLLNVTLGTLFAQAAQAMKDCGVASGTRVDFIASHGHTVAHLPPRNNAATSATLQIGEPAIIAQTCGVPVVSDFRPADMAAGGQGAPLVPYADWVLFRRPDCTIACLNIGGIANVTVVTPQVHDVFAFDTGPGNMPIDGLVRRLTRGREQYDEAGALASKGKILEPLKAVLLDESYFRLAPPKSTGREEFGERYLESVLRLRHDFPVADLVATVTGAVGESITAAVRQFVLPRCPIEEVIVSGGGAHNVTLMRHLRAGLPEIPARTSDDYGIPVDAREALAFAILGNETLCGTPANVPSATGARRSVILGRITPV
ncbi:MAG: anhydro-N-acetylmuramic acid kinase [Candidatus Hydrogenedentes bacterium]|nr:anhydro-N-acetylmuramic acid kinase [Candidatus Hydrogenedentota bacterium]